MKVTVVVVVLAAGCTWRGSITHPGYVADPKGPCLQLAETHGWFTLYKHGIRVGNDSRETFEDALADRPASLARLHRSDAVMTAARAVLALGLITGGAITTSSYTDLGSETAKIGIGTSIGSALAYALLWLVSDDEFSAAVLDYNNDARLNGCPTPESDPDR